MQTTCRTIFALVLLSTFALTGCSSKVAPRVKVYWPPPPAESQMQWILTYASNDDFPKTERQISAEKFLGKHDLDFLVKPSGVASRGDGVLYVADIDANEIRVLDFNNNTSETYSEEMPVALPVGMAVDSRGALFVADINRKHVVEFNPQRQVVRVYGVGDLQRPTYLALDETRGRLYVSDIGRNEVQVFDLTSGAKLFSFGGRGNAEGRLYGPQGIAVDKQGRVFVAEQFNARIQVFDTEGQHLYMFGKRGDKIFNFEGPRGLAFDSQGNLFVAEARKSALLVFKPDGSPLTYLGGTPSQHRLGFTLPTSVYIDPNDRIYIGDSMNRRVTIWQMLTPEYLAEEPLDSQALREIEERVEEIKRESE